MFSEWIAFRDSKFSRFRVDPFHKRMNMWENKKEVTKIVSLVKLAGTPCVSSFLEYMYFRCFPYKLWWKCDCCWRFLSHWYPPSGRIWTMNAQTTLQGIRAAALQNLLCRRVPAKKMWILTTAMQQSCKFARQLHGHLAAAVQRFVFLFLRSSCKHHATRETAIRTSCWGLAMSTTCVDYGECVDMSGYVGNLSAICLRHPALGNRTTKNSHGWCER